MSTARKQPALGGALYLLGAFLLCLYFTFASVQGDFGLFRRVQIDAEADALRAERSILEHEITALTNKTMRLSDNFLDLDLLDEQARDVLGMVRADEVVIR